MQHKKSFKDIWNWRNCIYPFPFTRATYAPFFFPFFFHLFFVCVSLFCFTCISFLQLDNQLRQRHYAALDLFLESARQQLRLLMERDSNVVMPPADDPRPAGAEASARPPTDSNPQPSSSSSKQDNPPSSNSS